MQMAIRTLGKMCRTLNFSDFTSRIVHPLVRVLDTNADLRKDAMDTICYIVCVRANDKQQQRIGVAIATVSPAWYPARHGVLQGTLSRTAWCRA